MEYIVTEKEMKEADFHAIHHIGMPSMVLMERAALSVIQVIKDKNIPLTKVLILCGCGNNGGDGIAIGRLLYQMGHQVTLVLCGNKDKCTSETKQQMQIASNYGLSIEDTIPENEFTLIIDAILGIGISRNIEGSIKDLIEQVNRMNCVKLAVDMPTGVDTDTGRIYGISFKAHYTVTFAWKKLGLILYPGAEYAGEVICTDIGITKQSLLKAPSVFSTAKTSKPELPQRKRNGNKGTFGKLLLIAGSEKISGAAYMCALAAFRAGIGMVTVCTHTNNRALLQQKLPEAMQLTYDKAFDRDAFLKAIQWASVIAIGPGLGQNELADEMLTEVLRLANTPIIIDADALNIIASSQKIKNSIKNYASDIILTPHMGEMSRLCQKEIKEIKNYYLETATQAAKDFQATIILKDARTIVTTNQPDKGIYLNQTGNSGMATAGSGDVLTGIVAAMAAQNENIFEAAVQSVFLHATAGDLAAERMGQHGMMACDIIEMIAECIKSWEGIQTC